MNESARQLTRAVASGDAEAFARFYESWFGFMYDCARKATRRDESFCLDVVQDACCKLIRSLRPLPDEASLRRYVTAAVQSCAYDRLRAEKRRLAREERSARERSRSEEGRESSAELEEQLVWLRTQLETIDDRSLTLLIMRHRFGWTLSRIGEAMGLRTGAVDGRIRRTTETLRRSAMETTRDERPAK